ncbi:MAG TPA: replicative DNA helicase [Steroidobacteraceae bacterium]|nr:replicative DNA helicase [Steroidobacteraceae bacterium]
MSSTPKFRRDNPGATDLRAPPHSIEAEQAVLGGLMLDRAAWDNVGDVVTADDFFRPDHKLIFESIAALASEAQPCDPVTVSEHMQRLGKLQEAGGLAYLGTLTRDTPGAANARAYAEIVKERALLRSLVTAGGEIAGSVWSEEGESARELVEKAERRIFAIAEGSARGKGYVSARQALPALIDQIDDLYNNPNKPRGLPTGFIDFDSKTGGLRGGDLLIVAGRPSMGKSTLAINMAEYAALKDGIRASVAIFSLEMPAEQILTRMLSSVGSVHLGNIRSGKLSEDDWPRITSATKQLQDAKIFIDDTPALTPTELRARSRRIKREHGLDLIVVDYLQLMSVPGTKENRATEISEISRGLKALAKELNCPVIALSQLNRGVEQRENKKPVMSDLRECVAGDTLVCLTDGRRVPIRDLVGKQPEVWALDDEQKPIAARAEMVWSTGEKPVLKLELASGRSIRATEEHRVLSGDGWKPLGNCQPGDRVALLRGMPETRRCVEWPEHWLVLLGHLVGDGSYLKHQPLRYTTSSEQNSAAVAESARRFGSEVSRHAGRGNWHQLVISGNGNRWQAAGVGRWLKDLGIFGQRSHEKRLPAVVFQLSKPQIGTLLRHLWATDGCVSLRNAGQRGSPRVFFATCSEGLASDVAALLLRLGIVSRTRVAHSGNTCPMYSVDVSGSTDQQLFADRVGGFGPREAAVARLGSLLRTIASNTNVDTLPKEIFWSVRERMRSQGISQGKMAAMRGTRYGGTAHFGFAPSRAVIAEYAGLLEAPELKLWAQAPLFWDRVVAVEPAGVCETFDLTVPGYHNWLADGIVTHNSGAIEQDADMILLIYREEVYNKETPKKGVAEIDLAKHRNGETGDIRLTFRGANSRFENYVDPAYGEGIMR